MWHRTYGKTPNCKGCRYWSEMLAMSRGSEIVAMCLAPEGPQAGKYTSNRETCEAWKSGHYGAVDDPPNFGEETRRLYREEEEPEPRRRKK